MENDSTTYLTQKVVEGYTVYNINVHPALSWFAMLLLYAHLWKNDVIGLSISLKVTSLALEPFYTTIEIT